MKNFFNRPLVLFAVSLITGIMVGSISNSIVFAAAFLILIAAFFYFAYERLSGRKFVIIGILVFYATGAFQFLCLNHINTDRYAGYAEEYVSVRGYVASEPDIKESKVSYVVNVSEIGVNYEFKKINGKILLSTLLNEKTLSLEYGSELLFNGQLSLPKGVRNPGGFDYRMYLAQKGVSAVVFAMGGDIQKGEGREAPFMADAGRRMRMGIVRVIEKSLPRQQAGLLNGILIGYREGLTEEVQKAFSDAGLTHIMAVSGANVAFLIFPLVFVFKKLHVRHIIANALIIAFLVIFVYITGFEPSVLRAVVMGIVLLLGRILMRDPDIYTSLAFSAILLLVISPYMLFNIGFQLSYAATISLVLLGKKIRSYINFKFIHPKVAEILSATLSAQLGVLPVILFYFNKLSLISIVSNLLVIPLIEVITILGTVMAVLGQLSLVFSQILGYVNCLLLSFVLLVTKVSSELPFATIRTVTPPVGAVAAYYGALWFFFFYWPQWKKSIRVRFIAAAIALLVVCVLVVSLIPGGLEVYFLDVGEGDSTFIRTYSGKTILIDGGGSTNPTIKSKVGESVLIPFLLDAGVNTIDVVIATHGHTDHIQGLLPVIEQFMVGRLVIPSIKDEKEFKQLLEVANARKVKVVRCSKGDIIRPDKKTTLEVLHPPPNYYPENLSLNNTSIVLKLLYKETEVLFTGDAEIAIEELLTEDNMLLDADVLKVAHHGSDTSTSKGFLKLVKPKAAVVSVGKNNFGHPSQDVLERLVGNGVLVFRTDESGAVILKSDGKRISIGKTVWQTDYIKH